VPAARTAASDRSGISDAANNIAAPAPAEQDKEIAHRSAPAGAAPANGPNGANVPRRGMGGLSLISGLWPLLMVLAVIGGVAVFVKKYMPTNRLLLGSEVLRIVARTSLGSKQHLVLVKLGRRLVLLGVAPERISALSTVEDPDQVAMLLGEAASTRSDSMTQAFAASIGQESAAFDTEDADEDATAATHGHVQGLLSKVRQLTGKT
jgi:flagellar biogenesis protein FliO